MGKIEQERGDCLEFFAECELTITQRSGRVWSHLSHKRPPARKKNEMKKKSTEEDGSFLGGVTVHHKKTLALRWYM
jgi:hypothetical protein